ncbi:MAG: hypothetical protein U0Y68_01860 [Blastocatellia bacterium]
MQKAFALRERVSERERLRIDSGYYLVVAGDIEKYFESTELYNLTYPRDFLTHSNLARFYTVLGQDEKGIKEAQETIRLNPDFGTPHNILASAFRHLGRFEEAKAEAEQAVALTPDRILFHETIYFLALMRRDTAVMQQQVDWASLRPGEYAHLTWQADTAAFAGQWQKARELSNRVVEVAAQRKLQEVTGDTVASNTEIAAILGHCQQSHAELARAASALVLPRSYFRAGIALALCGAATQAQTLTDEAIKRYPKHTLLNEIYLPLIRAALELQRGNRTQAIQLLEPARRYESVSFFYQNYLRGQAYLGERNGTAAAAEFQTILDHRGWSPASPLYPLAHLGLARAAMLQGDTAKARKSYQDFFTLWKDADADLPLLIEAKKEYEKLK